MFSGSRSSNVFKLRLDELNVEDTGHRSLLVVYCLCLYQGRVLKVKGHPRIMVRGTPDGERNWGWGGGLLVLEGTVKILM